MELLSSEELARLQAQGVKKLTFDAEGKPFSIEFFSQVPVVQDEEEETDFTKPFRAEIENRNDLTSQEKTYLMDLVMSKVPSVVDECLRKLRYG